MGHKKKNEVARIKNKVFIDFKYVLPHAGLDSQSLEFLARLGHTQNSLSES